MESEIFLLPGRLLATLTSSSCPGFEIRDFPSPRMTASNADELILPRALAFFLKAPETRLSPLLLLVQIVLSREGQELDLTTRGCKLRPSSGVFYKYRMLTFRYHSSDCSPLELYYYYYYSDYYYCCCRRRRRHRRSCLG